MRTILAAFAVAGLTAAVWSQPCDDVTKLDVANLTIRTARRTFAFRDGIAVNYDVPPEETAGHPPDWQAEIERDTVLRPAPGVAVRFLLIHDSHLTGSGWRYYLTGFRCAGGQVREVFHRHGLSLRVERLDAHAVTVSLNGNVRNYVWSRRLSRYVREAAGS